MGVACLDWDHARRAGLHCLHLFSRGALGSDHPLAIELCQDLLEALNAFIDGSEPSMELKRYMARDLFQCINEGPTEGLHAIIKRGLIWYIIMDRTTLPSCSIMPRSRICVGRVLRQCRKIQS